ncbi:NADH-quinone oxidoreductase subunit NuoH [Helicobacter sp. 11S02596-1]|uniref:NADH-quinone oxidoreductase subunit NuoH n=1 Tax=Helicobacter sp. 11S02596-1 TaxID=1476194 RepID=UPI000BA5CA91|nr:NADH-quinone oxidoreductase subunit NuoH [Helicobacter sp. 11S02596-1]PAF44284.1 NADH-quinone oxidoreductase subunit H [Helicobacter sp. 11S02596-1]
MSAYIIETLIKILVVVLVFSFLGAFATYLERKVLAFFQRRLGPVYVGPWGLFQVLADGIKLFSKEDILPMNANKLIFTLAPIIAMMSAFISMAPIPFFGDFTLFGYPIKPIISDINVGLLFFLAVGSVGIYAPILAGLSSGSKYSLIGAARAAIQLLSFEVVSTLTILAPLMIVGSLSLVAINDYQSGSVLNWLVFKQPLAFVLFLVASYAELNRTPFDLLEHEAEIIAGYATEYSGLKWGMFFLAEYAHMFAFCFVISIIFFGGYNPLWFIPGGLAIILKVCFFVFLAMWARATFPHIRPDQLMQMCWKIMMPLALLNILLTSIAILL